MLNVFLCHKFETLFSMDEEKKKKSLQNLQLGTNHPTRIASHIYFCKAG